MKHVLLKDIVIPAGTVLDTSPWKREYGEGNFECTLGLSKDSFGTFTYCIEPNDPALAEWFAPLKG